jgi:hypothetical protein
MPILWTNAGNTAPISYTCGYCGNLVGPSTGYSGGEQVQVANQPLPHTILICSFCNKPTYFERRDIALQTPAPTFGNSVTHVPDEASSLFDEARRCVMVHAYTASVLSCRKLLMHIAVVEGVPEGNTFVQYIDFLADRNFIPPNGRGWVDYIRLRGNEANHTIQIMTKVDAENLLTFSEMLLKFIYEFPHRVLPPAP